MTAFTRLPHAMSTALVLALMVAAPQGAGAVTLCVGAYPGCSGIPYSGSPTGLQQALDDAGNAVAHPGDDTIYVARGTYLRSAGFDAAPGSGETVHIIGEDRAATVLEADGSVNGEWGVNAHFANAPASSISRLTIRMAGAPTGVSGALRMVSGRADHLIASVAAGVANGRAMNLANATIEDSIATLAGPGSVVDTAGTVQLTNSVVDLGAAAANRGVLAVDSNIELQHSTVVGTGANQWGVYIQGASGPVSGIVKDSLIWMTGASSNPMHCAVVSPNEGMLELRFTGMKFVSVSAGAGNNDCNSRRRDNLDLTSREPTFRDLAARDLRPRYDSPVIDQGDPTTSPAAPARDVVGGARVVAADMSSAPIIDIGASEYQPIPPTITSLRASTAQAKLLVPVTFVGKATDPEGDPIRYRWTFDDGGEATGETVKHTFGSNGAHAVTLIVSDFNGATATRRVSIPVGPAAGKAAGGDSTGPVIKRLRPPKVAIARRGRRGFAVRAGTRAPVDSFKLTLSEAATMKVALVRLKSGRIVGGRCIANAKGHGKSCTAQMRLQGSAKLKVPAGKSYLTFGGRFGGKLLRPGFYGLGVKAWDSNMNASKSVWVVFRLR